MKKHLRAALVVTVTWGARCQQGSAPAYAARVSPVGVDDASRGAQRRWRNPRACPRDLTALRESRCFVPANVRCQYGECMGRPAMDAVCAPVTHRWRERWVSCNPPEKRRADAEEGRGAGR
ncbi:MAG: hypothetical protein U0325_08160 [Polyangiales bacterium]